MFISQNMVIIGFDPSLFIRIPFFLFKPLWNDELIIKPTTGVVYMANLRYPAKKDRFLAGEGR